MGMLMSAEEAKARLETGLAESQVKGGRGGQVFTGEGGGGKARPKAGLVFAGE